MEVQYIWGRSDLWSSCGTTSLLKQGNLLLPARTVSSYCLGLMKNWCFNPYRHWREPRVLNNLARFTSFCSPFLSMSSLSSSSPLEWVWLQVTCSTAVSLQEREERNGSARYGSDRTKGFAPSLHSLSIKGTQGFLFGRLRAGCAKFLLSKTGVGVGFCPMAVMGKLCNHQHSFCKPWY